MMVIDAHLHFWKYHAAQYSWIDGSMPFLQRDFLPSHIIPEYKNNSVSGCIAVEAHQSDLETVRLLAYAADHAFIRGVVGYVNLLADDIDKQLYELSDYKKLKGFRMNLQAEAPEYMLQPAFLNGISKLAQYNFTYDLVITPTQLTAALELVSMFPNQRFVINHLAKPCIKNQQFDGWKEGIQALSDHKNVFCKISGMATEAHWDTWTVADLKPYLDIVVGYFGTDRLLYGSDWPVCLLATSYCRWLQVAMHFFKDYNDTDKEKIFGKNAEFFYNL